MRGTSPPMDSAHSTSRGTASVPSQDSAPAAGSGGPSDRDVESQMAKEIAAENQKLIASMQPDQATTLTPSSTGICHHNVPIVHLLPELASAVRQ